MAQCEHMQLQKVIYSEFHVYQKAIESGYKHTNVDTDTQK